MQDMTVQYNTIQYNTIAHFTQNNIKLSRQPSICNITRINQEHTLSIRTQKWVATKVDESILKTTRYVQGWVNHAIQYSVSHISPSPTPHSTSLPLYALHFATHRNSFPFTSFSWSPPLFKFPSLHLSARDTFPIFSLYILDFPPLQNLFISLHLSHFSPCSWKYSISSSLRIYFTSLITTFHFTYYTSMKLIQLHVHGTFFSLSISNWVRNISVRLTLR